MLIIGRMIFGESKEELIVVINEAVSMEELEENLLFFEKKSIIDHKKL